MPGPHANQCVRDLVQNRVANFVLRVQLRQPGRKRDKPFPLIAAPKPPDRPIKLEFPAWQQSMLPHQLQRQTFRVS
jgi:hypothetical protein